MAAFNRGVLHLLNTEKVNCGETTTSLCHHFSNHA